MATSRPTIHDVASRAGMSKSLVFLALSGSPEVSDGSRARILKAAEELGYRPNAAARSLVVRRSRTIGVLVLALHDPCEYRSVLFNCVVFAGVVFGNTPDADAECLTQCAGAVSI